MRRVNGIQCSAISTKGNARQCLLRQVVAVQIISYSESVITQGTEMKLNQNLNIEEDF